ncbi:MAG: DUF4258 domain-containing protein [archaeon]
MKKIIFSNHATKRMFQRGIGEKDIESAVEKPDYKVQRGAEIEAYKKLNGETLKVVYAETESFIKIITVVWT